MLEQSCESLQRAETFLEDGRDATGDPTPPEIRFRPLAFAGNWLSSEPLSYGKMLKKIELDDSIFSRHFSFFTFGELLY
jgi:hypothetical protein